MSELKRKRIRIGEVRKKFLILEFLNYRFTKLNHLSSGTLSVMKQLEIDNFSELKRVIEEFSPSLKLLSFENRREIDKIFKAYNVKLPSHWVHLQLE